MADTITEYNQRLEKFKQGLPSKIFGKVAEYAGATIRAQVNVRVENNHLNANNVPFKPYSTEPMLTSGHYKENGVDLIPSMWSKGTVKKYKKGKLKGKAAIKEKYKDPEELNWVTIKKSGKNIHLFELPGGYAEYRRLLGRQSAAKDFSMSRLMWQGWDILRDQSESYEDGFRVRMGGTTEHSQNMITYNSEREGIDIIDMTDEEQIRLHQNVDKWVLEFAKECGL